MSNEMLCYGIYFEMKPFNWLKLVARLAAANQNALFQHSIAIPL